MNSSLVMIVAMAIALGCVLGDDVTAPVEAVVVGETKTIEVAGSPAEAKATTNNQGGWMKVLSCFLQDDANDCFEHQTYKVVKSWIDSARKTKSPGQLKEKAKPEKDKGIMDHLGDIFTSGVSRFLSLVVDDDDEEAEKKALEVEEEIDQEFGQGLQEAEKRQLEPAFLNYLKNQLTEYKTLVGRKKKKGKLKKLIALIKLLVLGAVAKAKITLILDKLGFLLKLKFFVVAFLHLLIALAKLWFEWSKHKTPQKVIYYEHAQHQHHYDNEHHHDDGGWFGGGGSDDKKGGWLGGLWSRSIDEPSKKVSVAATPQQDAASHVYYPQDAAYSAYRPQEYSQQYPAYRQS